MGTEALYPKPKTTTANKEHYKYPYLLKDFRDYAGRVIIEEDELIAAEYLKEVLIAEMFSVAAVIDNGKEAMEKIITIKPDIVLMDIMLRDKISGSEVALFLKIHSPSTAIIFLTAYANNEMTDYALESNCYGYLMKPYNEQEIVNTLKIIYARLHQTEPREKTIRNLVQITSELSFNIENKKLLRNSKEVKIGKNSIKLLELLCKNANNTVSNEQIAMHLWDEEKSFTSIRTQIHRMKNKIGENIVHNVNGRGYMIETIC